MSDITIQNAIHCMKAMICEEVCEECDYYGKTGTDHCEADAVRMAIKALEEQPHWIPCSERLPDYGVSVLTWDGYCYCVEKRIPYIRDEDGEPISSDWWVSDEYNEYESDHYPNLRDGACIAWMPLPKPYGGESE